MSIKTVSAVAIAAFFALLPFTSKDQSKTAVAIISKSPYIDSLKLIIRDSKKLKQDIKDFKKTSSDKSLKEINQSKSNKNG